MTLYLSLIFLASGLNFHTCMGKRLFLNGGENTHFFPVVSKLGTTVKTHHIRSGEHGGLAAALSRLAGLGKADSFVPASEQSVKDLHNLLLAVASSTGLNSLNFYLGLSQDHQAHRARDLRYCK
jgi:hypothetical protein